MRRMPSIAGNWKKKKLEDIERILIKIIILLLTLIAGIKLLWMELKGFLF